MHTLTDAEFLAVLRRAKKRGTPKEEGATLADVFERERLIGRCLALTVANVHAMLEAPKLDGHEWAPLQVRACVAPEFAHRFERLTGAHRSAKQASTLVMPWPYHDGSDALTLTVCEPPPSFQRQSARVWWEIDSMLRATGTIALSCTDLDPRTRSSWNARRSSLFVDLDDCWRIGQFVEAASEDGEARVHAQLRVLPRVVTTPDEGTRVQSPWGWLRARDEAHKARLVADVEFYGVFAYEVPLLEEPT